MQLIQSISQVQDIASIARLQGKKIGLVPTMGALHDGHLTLFKNAKKECDVVFVSVYVNPTQFNNLEDLDKYPRTLESDCEKCKQVGVDFVFAPSNLEMYPEGYNSWVELGGITEILEGEKRPGHFRGVTTVCSKLFNIVQPDYAYFGKKDYQQLKVIEKMVKELNYNLTIVPVEIVRESDGLAMSSRNKHLNADERKAALILSKALKAVKESFDSGEFNAGNIQNIAQNIIKAEPLAVIDYVEVADSQTLEHKTVIDKNAVVLLAVKIGSTRLIDNIVLSL